MGGKLSKRKKGYSVNEPKGKKEETTEGGQIGEVAEEEVGLEKEKLAAEGGHSTELTAEDAIAPSQESAVTPTEEVTQVKDGGLEKEPAALVASQDLKPEDALVVAELSLRASEEEQLEGTNVAGEVPHRAAEPPVTEIHAAEKVSAVAEEAPLAEVMTVSEENEAEVGACQSEMAANAPTQQEELCPEPVVLGLEPAAFLQPGEGTTEVTVAVQSAAEVNQIPDHMAEPKAAEEMQAETPEPAMAEVHPSISEELSEVKSVAATTSEQQESVAAELESTPEVIPESRDPTVYSTDSQAAEPEVQPNPVQPPQPSGTDNQTLVTSSEGENVEAAPASQEEPVMPVRSETPSKIPKDTDTGIGFPRETVFYELSSTTQPPADVKVEAAGDVVDGAAEEDSRVFDVEPAHPSAAAEVGPDDEELPRDHGKLENGDHGVLSPEEAAQTPTPEQNGQPLEQAAELQPPEESTEPAQGCVNGIGKEEERSKGKHLTNDCELKQDMNLISNSNVPINETQIVLP